jgi:hypothetical protein
MLNWLTNLFRPSAAASPIRPAPMPVTPAMPTPLPASSASSEEISDAALNLIVTEEDGAPAYYTSHYTHFDWPGGASGPTLGVGYDCGYSTQGEAIADWQPYLASSMLDAIGEASGRKGSAAQQWVVANQLRVTVPFAVGLAQFKAKEIPKWAALVRAALPNYDLLPLDCRGALISLAYNRGCSFTQPGSRDTEMRNIRTDMIAKDFADIPNQFLAMRRLWPPATSDLWKRRTAEARLFQQGLAANKTQV